MVNPTTQILCITNNYSCKEQLRGVLYQSRHTSFLFVHNTSQAIQEIKAKRYPLILIDTHVADTNLSNFDQLLELLSNLCLNLSTIIIVPELNHNSFYRFIKHGFTYITDMKVGREVIPAILEHMEEFQSTNFLTSEISYKGLCLYPKQNIVIFRKCTIILTNTLMLILLYMIKHEGYCDIVAIRSYIESIQGKQVSDSYVTVNMNRLCKKIKDATGLKIIKSRYGIGYHLVL